MSFSVRRYFLFLRASEFFPAVSAQRPLSLLDRLKTLAGNQEFLMLIASGYATLTANAVFWRAVESGASPMRLMVGAGVAVTALHFALLALVCHRTTLKPCLALFFIFAGFARFFMDKFGVYIDPNMARNVLSTDFREASELLTWDLLRQVSLYLVLPCFLLYQVQLPRRCFKTALLVRGVSLLAALSLGLAGVMVNFQALAAMMRNHKEIRYLVTPANVVYSFARTASSVFAVDPPSGKVKVAPDAVLGERWQGRKKPALFVIVVGETVRAANFGKRVLENGAERQTTPGLAQQDIVWFPEIQSCGSDTAVSLPCIFSDLDQRRFSEKAARRRESLLHVLARLGFRVVWRDNQSSGCKGVCAGLEEQRLHDAADPVWCRGTRCFDEILLKDLDRLTRTPGNLVVVLHQLGNHGPAYYQRYPAAFRRFTPTCDTADFARCERDAIVNSYDNAILYTDHFLLQTIGFLKSQQKHYDTALLYVSDHGESLGEYGLFLHGMPYAIAPKEQTRVPLLMWFSPSYVQNFGLNLTCLRQATAAAVSHDHLFHSILGLLDIATSARDPSLDLSFACRG